MKSNKLITSALLALGLISSANASSTANIGGVNYTVVYITGSTSSRTALYNAVDAATGGVFDSTPTFQPSSGVTSSSSAYNAYGTISGTPYLISVDLTGSEAGLAALEGVAISNPETASSLSGYTSGANNLPGTPEPTGFIDPITGNNDTAAPDLAIADTSQAVSQTASLAPLTDYGVIGVTPDEWVKGDSTAKDNSWTHLVNVDQPQLSAAVLGSGRVNASFLTGTNTDTDKVYLIGRNKGSGTRVNALLDTLYGVTTAVTQYAPANSTYVSGALTVGTPGNITSASGLVKVSNDGFDAGSGVGKTLTYNTTGLITLGYVGITDGNTAVSGGGVVLTLDGVPENDATVINGTYSFWGHTHLYGGATPTTAANAIAEVLTGYDASGTPTPNEGLGASSTAGGALEASYGTGGGREANPGSVQSPVLDPAVLNADKPGDGDAGYPTQL